MPLYNLDVVCVHGVWVGSSEPCLECSYAIWSDQCKPAEQRMSLVQLTPEQMNANAGRDYTFNPADDLVGEYRIRICIACGERYVLLDSQPETTFCPGCGTSN